MHEAAAQELRLCAAAAHVEAALATGDAGRRFNAEAFQRVLWRHRDDVLRLIEDHEKLQHRAAALEAALQPFARCAAVIAPGHNPVLISLPSQTEAGRTWIQLRPADFRRAAAVLEGG